jgi:predicted transcriptional regulator
MPRNTSPDKRVTVRLPKPLFRKLERLAAAKHRTISQEVREMLNDAPERKKAA